MPAIPEEITQLMNVLQHCVDDDAISKAIDNAHQTLRGFEKLSATLYGYQGYEFRLMLRPYADDLSQKLGIANDCHIEAAPLLIEHIKVGRDESVVITHQPGCEETQPFSLESDLSPVSPEAKEQFIQEMKGLAANGYVHQYAVKGRAHWFMNPKTGKIILNAWESLSPLDEVNQNEVIERFKSLL